ncbi:MAG: endonuclease/exonuclease/phosphatase family protein [Phycisphaerales bacterium]|nr:endonuclease/exonuclease/phosphatase family protein [Phycisphaerales bacterium]
MTRILAWNLRHGGGSKRMAPIALSLLSHEPDVVVLTEFRRTTGGQIAGVLADHGLCHQASTDPAAHRNGLIVASRHPIRAGAAPTRRGETALSRGPAAPMLLEPAAGPRPPSLRHRWLDFEIPDLGLDFTAVHAPHDDPFTRSGPSTARAACFRALVQAARERGGRPHVMIGDFNSGRHHLDEAGATFTLTAALGMIASLGYIDAWRHVNGQAREFTWYSHLGGGFRIDHALVSASAGPRVRDCRYSHPERENDLSDHSVLLLDLA